MVHFPPNCTGPPICLVLGGSSARTPAVFRVHCCADEGATTEGRGQLEALGWEVKQRWGGCWMAGWAGPLAVHFPGPRGDRHIRLWPLSYGRSSADDLLILWGVYKQAFEFQVIIITHHGSGLKTGLR